MVYETPAKKIMSEKQIAHFIGKRVNPDVWQIPEGYGLCTITGKFHAWDDLGSSFPHCNFTDEQLAQLGRHGAGWCEDAELLSNEGFYLIMDRVRACGLVHVYYGYELEEEGEGAAVTESHADDLRITPFTLVNDDRLIEAQVQATVYDCAPFSSEKFIGIVTEVKLNKYGKFAYFKTPALVGGKWIPVRNILGFAHYETQKVAS